MATNYGVRAELRAVRLAIKELTEGAQSATVTSNGGTRQYSRQQMFRLTEREEVLMGRLSRANCRKRTAPDFS